MSARSGPVEKQYLLKILPRQVGEQVVLHPFVEAVNQVNQFPALMVLRPHSPFCEKLLLNIQVGGPFCPNFPAFLKNLIGALDEVAQHKIRPRLRCTPFNKILDDQQLVILEVGFEVFEKLRDKG